MSTIPTARRDLGRRGLRVVIGLGTLALGAGALVGARPAGATSAGSLTVVDSSGQGNLLSSGGSATGFNLIPPVGAACTGDSASGGYRVQSYMVPSTTNPSTLTFDSQGPVNAGGTFPAPLYLAGSGSPWVSNNTAVNTGILPAPSGSFDFSVYSPGQIPAGTYNIGFACSKNGALDKYWNVQLTFTTDVADVPAQVTWTVGSPTPPTTTTTTTVAGTTTTVAGTTTTVAGDTTTTLDPNATTTTSAGLVRTGSSPVPKIFWAFLLLLGGETVVLVGRRIRVHPPKVK
jgi:hypothetical protein